MEQEDFPLTKSLFIISKAYSLIQAHFAHWQGIPDLNLDENYEKYLNQVLSSTTRFEFDLIMMEFISTLQNGHSWFTDKWIERNYPGSIGFKFKPIDNKWVVFESKIDEIHLGDIITKINQENFTSFYEQKKRHIPASSEKTRKMRFTYRHYLFPQEFRLELNNTTQVEINQKNYPSSLHDDQNSTTSGYWIYQDELAYIKIPNFRENQNQDRALEYVEEFSNAKMIIFDVRGNTGGSTPEKLISRLMNRPYRFWAESTNITLSLFQFYYDYFKTMFQTYDDPSLEEKMDFYSVFHQSNFIWYPKKILAKENAFQGKLCILFDGYTGSAAEDFVIPFKDNERAILIGQTTRGSTGQPYMFNIDNDITICIGTKRAYFPDGAPFEGIGITPDVKIIQTVENIKSQVDGSLNYAKELYNESKEKVFTT